MQGLSLTIQQKLQQKLSPAQIQIVRMLELPSCELQQRINEELQENPALEEGKEETSVNELEETEMEDSYENPLQNDDFNYDDYIQDDETPEYKLHQHNYSSDDETPDIPFSAGTSFGEYLKSQVYLTKMDKPQRHIAKFVVGNIDEDGYLRRTAEELVDDLAFREGLNVSDEEMAEIIEQIKGFDPSGVGAYDLQECLLIQLRQKEATPAIQTAIRILNTNFEDFSKRRFDRICMKLSISEDELKDAITEITRLNPKPGSAWTGTIYENHQTTVIPDFIIENRDGELNVILNTGDLPSLRISKEYKEMLEDYNGNKANRTKQRKEALQFVKDKIDSAKWFISAIEQRNQTLLRTMNAIIEMQKDFFLEGDETYLKPMILQEIADRTGYDVSTISRVSNSKYVQTEYGIFPLKYFFSERMTNSDGEEISTREIKKIMQELIDAEDKSHPLTDDQLVDLLKENGYLIARRTIAKYRDLLNIPVARLRREI